LDASPGKPASAPGGPPAVPSLGRPEGIKEIFWIAQPSAAPPNGPLPRLATVLRPRGGQLLHAELVKLKQAGIGILVSLMEPKEAVDFGLAREPELAEELGLLFLPFPIRDHTVPANPALFRGFVHDLAERLKAGRAVGIHCQGSIGRATLTAACVLIHLGWRPADALAAVQEARGIPVDTQEQEEWILNYKP
jgi:protein-tyrosine phosphatase